MKLLIQELASAIVFIFGFGVLIWLWSTHEVIRDETRAYQQQNSYERSYIGGELYNDASQETEPGRENQNVPR